PQVSPLPATASDYCSDAALCSVLHITGVDSVCVSNTDTLVYKNGKQKDCSLPVQWQADPSRVTLLSTTDSTVKLLVKDKGAIKLYATMAIRCKVVTDSIVIHAFASPAGVDLGGDLALCKQSTVVLHAGSG